MQKELLYLVFIFMVHPTADADHVFEKCKLENPPKSMFQATYIQFYFSYHNQVSDSCNRDMHTWMSLEVKCNSAKLVLCTVA